MARVCSQIDTIWGTAVKDPYRWMEDIKSPEVEEWLHGEEKIARKYSGKTYSLTEYLKYYSNIQFKPIFKSGKYYFSYSYSEGDKTPELYYQEKTSDEPALLFDPNRLDKHNSVAIKGVKLSTDNTTLALMLSRNGSDWHIIRFLDMKTEKLLKDTIDFVKYSDFHWYKNGILYCKFDVKNKDESLKGLIKGYALFYHRIGTNQKDDILIYKPESEYSILDFNISEQKGYAIIKREFMNSGKKYYAISFSNLKDSLKFNFKDFIITTKEDLYFDVIGKLNGKFLVQTNYFAPNGAIYKYDPVGINRAEKFIPEYADQLQYSKIMGNKIISAYSTDSVSFGVIKDSTGKFLNIWRIPEGHSFTEFSGEENDSILIFGFHSFFSPATIYQMNVNTLEKKPLSSTLINFDINGLITRRVYYKSKDSTVIPMYLTYKNGIKLNGKNPVILYGYGGFGVSMEPFFSPANIIFFRNGGILATPCLRGGGDYPGWHEKGMRLNKQNTFDDFIAAAEFLISKKYTSSEKLAAMGGSNGGLLVGATMLQRPDLFKVVVSESGAFDMLRYHLYNIGYYYKDEFGNITDSLDFRNLRKYSPVQNVKSDVNYPATLLVASDNDDRVSPFHSFKFMAALQANGTTINPDVIYYEKNAGHSGSDAIEKRIETQAYIYAFIFKYLGIENKITYNSTGW